MCSDLRGFGLFDFLFYFTHRPVVKHDTCKMLINGNGGIRFYYCIICVSNQFRAELCAFFFFFWVGSAWQRETEWPTWKPSRMMQTLETAFSSLSLELSRCSDSHEARAKLREMLDNIYLLAGGNRPNMSPSLQEAFGQYSLEEGRSCATVVI